MRWRKRLGRVAARSWPARMENLLLRTMRARLSRGRAQLKVLLDEADARERRTVEARGAEGTLSSATSSHVRRSGS